MRPGWRAMTAPWFKTHIDVEPGRILVEVELIGVSPVVLDDEQAARLRPRLAEVIECVLDALFDHASTGLDARQKVKA